MRILRTAFHGMALATFLVGSIPEAFSEPPIVCSPPTVTLISPNSGPVTGGTSVTITGTNFSCSSGLGVPEVKFGSATATSFITYSSTSIIATSPAGTGTVHVTVKNSIGAISATSAADQFTYAPPTDSQNIRSLQTSITTLVATTSGLAITNAIDGGINDGFSNGGTPTSFGPNGGFINFAAPEPRSLTASRAEEAFAALSYAGNHTKAPDFNKAPPRLDRDWSAWADIRGTGWKLNDTTGNGNDLRGNQINLTAGLGRKLNADTLVGVVVGYENFKYDVAALAGSLKGDGETIGGYFARQFGGNLRFDAALAWTNLNYSATAGTATGSFIGSRWLASTGLTGNYKLNVYVVEPSAKLYVLWEREKAWTDSLGTLQDARNFSAGRTALGAKVARPFEASNGWKISPYAGLYGDWRFQSDSALPTGTPVTNIGTGWSGRVTGGVSATALRGGTVSLGGEYGGLGANYKIWTGNVRASVPF